MPAASVETEPPAAQAPPLWYGAGHVADPPADPPAGQARAQDRRRPRRRAGRRLLLDAGPGGPRRHRVPDRGERLHRRGDEADRGASRSALYAEMLARIKEDDQTVPYRRRGFFYYSRTEKGKQYPIYCRKAGSLDAPEQVMLDLNAARGGPSVPGPGRGQRERRRPPARLHHRRHRLPRVHAAREGPRHRRAAPGAGREGRARSPGPRTGRRSSTSPRTRPSDRTGSTATRLGAAVADLLYEETDALFRLHVGRSRSLAYLFLISGSFTTTETRFCPRPTRRARGG